MFRSSAQWNNLNETGVKNTQDMKKNAVSTRRTRVQAKRKRLGLNVEGKIQPFMWDGEVIKPGRKKCYCAALQTEQMMQTYAKLGNPAPEWLHLMQIWIAFL